jgi:hypothetical protein
LLSVQSEVSSPAVTVGQDQETQPGSAGEHLLQAAYGSEERAARFYEDQVRPHLLPTMVEFVARMEMMFLSTSDGKGECDSSLRAGPPGFLQVLDDRHVAYPEYRGNGVHASLGNISENPHVGMLMIDFERDLIGLHVNGRARIVDDEVMRTLHPELPHDLVGGRKADRWVVVEVDEAYVHCRKHIPRMVRVHERRAWGSDDPARKGGDYFGAKARAAFRSRSYDEAGEPATPVSSESVSSQSVSSLSVESESRHSVEVQAAGAQLSGEQAAGAHSAGAHSAGAHSAGAQSGGAQSAGAQLSGAQLFEPGGADPELTGPIPAQRSTDRSRFPSTTHLLTGSATARPLRGAARPGRAGRRIRWLSS